MKFELSRRNFLSASLAATMLPRLSRAASPNDEIRIAVLGLRWRGQELTHQFSKVPGVRVVALCDPDSKLLAERSEELATLAHAPKRYTDPRQVMDDAEIDAVAIATPNHWHSLLGIWACQAGKDVYIEKPVSHNLFEGWQLLNAARQHRRIVQTGTQNRSDTGLREAATQIHNGRLGPVRLVRGLCYNRRPSTGLVTTPQPIPKEVDYNIWSGPAELKPIVRQQFHYDWHWNYTYGNGDVGNQGVHELDICRWMLGADDLPATAISVGGRFGYEDNATTPNTLMTYLGYETAPILFEVRGLPAKAGEKRMDTYRGKSVGLVVECEHGYFAGGRGGGALYEIDGKLIQNCPGDNGDSHAANFIDAVRSRDATTLRAEIAEGVLSSGLSHFCNLSYQAGKPTEKEQIAERLQSEPLAAAAFDRMASHLEANEVDLSKTAVTLGPMLNWNTDARQFNGNDRANQLLTRQYREPFVVTDLSAT